MISIKTAKHLGDYRIRLKFSNNLVGVADLEDTITNDRRSVFRELSDSVKFRDFRTDGYTICWGNGLDLAPEYLFFLAFRNDPTWQHQFFDWGCLKLEATEAAA